MSAIARFELTASSSLPPCSPPTHFPGCEWGAWRRWNGKAGSLYSRQHRMACPLGEVIIAEPTASGRSWTMQLAGRWVPAGRSEAEAKSNALASLRLAARRFLAGT